MITRFKIGTDGDILVLSVFDKNGLLQDSMKAKSKADEHEEFFHELHIKLIKLLKK